MNRIYKTITPKVKSSEEKWLKKVIANYQKVKPQFYVLAIIENKNLIGNLIAEKFNHKTKSAEIGFWIGKDY